MEILITVDNTKIFIKEGIVTIVGRNDIKTKNDKRCSKKQLSFTRKSNSLYVTRNGKNPSRLLRGDHDIILERGVATKIVKDDVIELVITMYPLFISFNNQIEEDDQTISLEEEKKFIWEWYDANDGSGKWKIFDDETQAIISKAYDDKNYNICLTHGVFGTDSRGYQVFLNPDFPMKQKNNRTNFERKIRRSEVTNNATKSNWMDVEESKPSIKDLRNITTNDNAISKKTNIPKNNTVNSLLKPQIQSSPKPEKEKKTKNEDSSGGWSNALVDIVKNPGRHKDVIIFQDEDVIIIKDKFPKAKVHLLCLPTEVILNFKALDITKIGPLKSLRTAGIDMIKKLKVEHPKLKFKMGFHAVPSMRQIHMHIISQDFDSEHMKNKKHWISFTNEEFFVSTDDFILRLENLSKVEFDHKYYEDLLKGPLVCHVCQQSNFANFPSLKQHIATH
jgi:aprataxin